MKSISVSYFALLTFMLLAPVPHGSLPVASPVAATWDEAAANYSPSFHLVSFMLLAVLVLSAGWPLSRGALVLVIIAYGLGTEVLQGFLPYRACELSDCLNDLAGTAAATAMLWPPRMTSSSPWGGPIGHLT